jgi:ribose/xylose/arabinose/galactoside ABC-type transport system permease subunit
MTDSEFTLIRATNNTGPITMGTTVTATTITWMNIGGTNGSGGTGTIIDTITIEIMIGTATGIDLLRCRITNWLSAA